jgi:hypothetical protein
MVVYCHSGLNGLIGIASNRTDTGTCLFGAFIHMYPLCSLFLDCLHAIPSTAQPLLPQADSVVAGADGEYITAETPAHTPCSSVDVKYGGFPVIWVELVWNLYSSWCCTYANPRMSRCARSCLGMQRQCTTWRAQLATMQRREPSLCGRAESVCFASFLSLR